MLDNDTREDHVEANGQVVGPGAMFVVGGEEAPYPGHWSLSAQERINCRCTILGSGLAEAAETLDEGNSMAATADDAPDDGRNNYQDHKESTA